MAESVRERIIRLVREMRANTVGRGASPAEAAAFAAKAAEWIEKYQIEEAELRAQGVGGSAADDIEVCQNILRTGKRVFNPGMSQVISALSRGMGCQCILIHKSGEACYGIVGDSLDADYVCQVATCVVPALQTMAMLEGREHGHEKAGLVRWSNQYLTGAAVEIRRRLDEGRRERSAQKEEEHKASGTALACITGETLFEAKRKIVKEAFDGIYPVTKTTRTRSAYDGTAQERGRAAGARVGLNVPIEEK